MKDKKKEIKVLDGPTMATITGGTIRLEDIVMQ